ncbi:hypothetical protein, partial [Halomonas sp. BM-2019]|uniref:hypothetical protein n=1 Tax=Halomonas sp. BM-2019 TaxID=2811227 RepID=UPI001B3C4B15
MDTRESQTPEEERQHLKQVLQPEDFEHPEPDEEQPEAKAPPSKGMQRLLPIVIVVLGLVVAA